MVLEGRMENGSQISDTRLSHTGFEMDDFSNNAARIQTFNGNNQYDDDVLDSLHRSKYTKTDNAQESSAKAEVTIQTKEIKPAEHHQTNISTTEIINANVHERQLTKSRDGPERTDSLPATAPWIPEAHLTVQTVRKLIEAIDERRVTGENGLNNGLHEAGLRAALIKHFRANNVLARNIDPYVICFQTLGVKDRESLENLLSNPWQPAEVREVQAQLKTAEIEWDELLKKIDAIILAQDQNPPEKTHEDRRKIRLVDCDSGKSVSIGSLLNHRCGKYTLFVVARFYGCYASERYIKTLEEHLEEFQRKLCNVVIVCKGTKEGGRKWRQLIGIHTPVLADEMGEFLSSFHFPISVWNMSRTSERCVLAAASIAQTLHLIDDKEKDLYQLGGEVLMCNRGKQFVLHKCHKTEDRPPWNELLEMIDDTVGLKVRPPTAENGTVTWEEGKLTAEKQKSRFCTVL